MTVEGHERLLLVGFMGAGKSSVGRLAAQMLNWAFVDVDSEVERRTGRTVAEIFATDGESAFREVERQVARELLSASRVVIASGGGWAASAEWRDETPARTHSVWLDVSVDESIRRASTQPGTRPLMEEGSAGHGLAELHKKRTPYYALADARVDTEGSTVEDVTARVLESLARSTDRTRTE